MQYVVEFRSWCVEEGRCSKRSSKVLGIPSRATPFRSCTQRRQSKGHDALHTRMLSPARISHRELDQAGTCFSGRISATPCHRCRRHCRIGSAPAANRARRCDPMRRSTSSGWSLFRWVYYLCNRESVYSDACSTDLSAVFRDIEEGCNRGLTR